MPQIGGAMKLSERTFGEFWVMDAVVAAGCQSASKFRGHGQATRISRAGFTIETRTYYEKIIHVEHRGDGFGHVVRARR
jgi:hypothetical protein